MIRICFFDHDAEQWTHWALFGRASKGTTAACTAIDALQRLSESPYIVALYEYAEEQWLAFDEGGTLGVIPVAALREQWWLQNEFDKKILETLPKD